MTAQHNYREERRRLKEINAELLEALLGFALIRRYVGEPPNILGDACPFCDSMQIPHLPLADGSPCPVEKAITAIQKARGEVPSTTSHPRILRETSCNTSLRASAS